MEKKQKLNSLVHADVKQTESITLVWLHDFNLTSQQIFIKLEKLIFDAKVCFKSRQAAKPETISIH